jgi:hypothetical protein
MKRLIVIVFAFVVCLGLSGSAATHKTFETVTVADTALGLTSTTYAPAGKPQMQACTARVETAEIRIRWDGIAPTASVGLVLSALDTFTVTSNEDISQVKMIRTGATSATVTFVCWAN